ncbi:MAG: hypothetical protein ACSLEY_01200, partial [Candidatus Saccharimonadales bacterium]
MSNVTVEIGHTYAPDRLVRFASADGVSDFYSPELGRGFNDTAEAARLRKIAEYFGESAIRVALVDDVAARESQKRSEENAWRWQQFLNASYIGVQLGTGVERSGLFHESDFEQDGRDLVAQIQDMDLPEGYRLSQYGRKLITGSGKDRLAVPLQGFKGVEDISYPSCQVLDLAWLQKRLSLAPEAITVLPAAYEEQQRGVEVLADLASIYRDAYMT